MPVLHLPDVPDDLYRRIEELAAADRVPLTEESLRLLRQAIDLKPPLGRANVLPLLEEIRRIRRGVRSTATEILASLGPKGTAAAGALKVALQDKEIQVAVGAADALAIMNLVDADVLAVGRKWLKDPNEEVRIKAALFVALGDPNDPAMIPLLIQAVKVPRGDGFERNVRATAISSLALLGPRAKEAFPLLKDLLLKSDDFIDVQNSSSALVRIDPDAALPVLIEKTKQNLAKGKDDSSAYLRLIGSMGPKGKPAVPFLLELVKSPGDELHHTLQAAALALAEIDLDAVMPVLIKKLESPDHYVRDSTAYALRDIGPKAKSAIPALTKALQDPDSTVRNRAR